MYRKKPCDVSSSGKEACFLIQFECTAFKYQLCRRSRKFYEYAAFFCFSTLQVFFRRFITPSKTRFKHIQNRLLRSAYIVTIMTAMCGLEPLFKGSQFPTSRQQVASPLSVTSRVLSTANLQRAKARLQEGDIIFRTRDTWLARLPASMTAHTAYAQAGIVTFE